MFMVKALSKALLKSLQVLNVKLLRQFWGWNKKPCSSTALWGRCWGQDMALKPCYPWAYKWLVHKLVTSTFHVINKLKFDTIKTVISIQQNIKIWHRVMHSNELWKHSLYTICSYKPTKIKERSKKAANILWSTQVFTFVYISYTWFL